jgi:hypothetical protein
MVIAKARGTKRKCQNEDCGLPFYDLNREAFECPNCATSFDLEREAPAAAPLASAYRSRRKPPELIIVAPPPPQLRRRRTVLAMMICPSTRHRRISRSSTTTKLMKKSMTSHPRGSTVVAKTRLRSADPTTCGGRSSGVAHGAE